MTNSSKRAYDLIIFDWDGTLMDSVGHIVQSMQAAMRQLSLPVLPAETIRNIIGLGMREAIESLYPGQVDDRFVHDFVNAYRTYYFIENAPQALFDGARECIEQLQAHGYQMAIATSKSRHGLDKVLQQTDLHGAFTVSRTADETASKPDPRMLHEILEQIGCCPRRALMVGDSEYDLQMAQRAGIDRVAATYGVHSAARLARWQPVGQLARLAQLVPMMHSLGREREVG